MLYIESVKKIYLFIREYYSIKMADALTSKVLLEISNLFINTWSTFGDLENLILQISSDL